MKIFKIAGYNPSTSMTLYRDDIDVVEPLLEGEWTEDVSRRRRQEETLTAARRAMVQQELTEVRGFNPQYHIDVRWKGEPRWLSQHPDAPDGALEGTYEIRVTFDVVDPGTVDSLVKEVLQKSTRTI